MIERTRIELQSWRERLKNDGVHPTAALIIALDEASRAMLAQFTNRFLLPKFDDRNASNAQKFVILKQRKYITTCSLRWCIAAVHPGTQLCLRGAPADMCPSVPDSLRIDLSDVQRVAIRMTRFLCRTVRNFF